MQTNNKQCESAVAVKLSEDAMKQMVGGLSAVDLVAASSLKSFTNALRFSSIRTISGIYVHL